MEFAALEALEPDTRYRGGAPLLSELENTRLLAARIVRRGVLDAREREFQLLDDFLLTARARQPPSPHRSAPKSISHGVFQCRTLCSLTLRIEMEIAVLSHIPLLIGEPPCSLCDEIQVTELPVAVLIDALLVVGSDHGIDDCGYLALGRAPRWLGTRWSLGHRRRHGLRRWHNPPGARLSALHLDVAD